MKETTKLKYVIIALGVVLAGTAPFVHKFFPRYTPEQIVLEQHAESAEITYKEYKEAKKELRKYNFGFINNRNLLNELGLPLTMLLIALVFLSSIVHINHRKTRITLTISAGLLLTIAFYYIIWVFFPRGDLPKPVYYIAIVTGAITATILSHFFITQNKVLVYIDNLRKLTRFIVVDVEEKYVSENDKEEYIEDIVTVTNTLK